MHYAGNDAVHGGMTRCMGERIFCFLPRIYFNGYGYLSHLTRCMGEKMGGYSNRVLRKEKFF